MTSKRSPSVLATPHETSGGQLVRLTLGALILLMVLTMVVVTHYN